MSIESSLSKRIHTFWQNKLNKYTLIGVLFGLCFPLFSWIFDIILNKHESFFGGILTVHKANPLHYIIDVAPIVIGVVTFFLFKKFEFIQMKLELRLLEANEKIQANARLAKLIGNMDFTDREVAVQEDDELGKSLLLMRSNLQEANKKENELNWIARGKDQVSDILRQYNSIDQLAYETLVQLINYINAIQGAFYLFDEESGKIKSIATYAYNRQKYMRQEFNVGQGLIGQCAFEMDIIYRREIPPDYISITSGILGDAKPRTILIVPLISDEKLQGIIEFASLEEQISDLTVKFVKELSGIIGQTIFNLKVNQKTARLLEEAQQMTEELRENEDELRKNAVEMKHTQEQLKSTNENLESQIQEVERAQKRLHSLLENASEVISIYDENGFVKYESPSVKHILGYSPEDVIGKPAFATKSGSHTKIKKAFHELLANPHSPKTIEYQYEKNGDVLYLEATGRNLLSNPAIGGVIFNIRDITVRKIAEKAQRMSGQMQGLSENSPDMIIRLGLDGKVFYANPVFKIYTGLDPKEVNRKVVGEIPLEEPIRKFISLNLSQVESSKIKVSTQVDFPTKFGMRIMQVNIIPEFNEEKVLETILFVAHDITEQKRIEQDVKDKNKAISDSINYAQRIQTAIIPDNRTISKALPNSFIFYKPRDVVSGDFPWFFKKDNIVFIAAVDCTGHGVPGALLSFIGYFLLNNIVDHDVDYTASKILDLLHHNVRKTLKQDSPDATARDGMDIAFCKIDLDKKELQYAGAHRPLYLVRKGELTQYRGNPKAIGGIPSRKMTEKDFVNHVVNYEENDKVFFFSDGLPDQIGGDRGRKYQVNRIREHILEHKDFSMKQYGDFFADDFADWKGNNKQIDDILLIGIEF